MAVLTSVDEGSARVGRMVRRRSVHSMLMEEDRVAGAPLQRHSRIHRPHRRVQPEVRACIDVVDKPAAVRAREHGERAVVQAEVGVDTVVEGADGREAGAAELEEGGVLVEVDRVAAARLLVDQLAVAEELDVGGAEDLADDVQHALIARCAESFFEASRKKTQGERLRVPH